MKKDVIAEDLKDIFMRSVPWDKLNGSTVLVTGAYGMLASYVVYMLLFLHEQGFRVKVIALVRSKEKFEERFGDIERHSNLTVYTMPLNREIHLEEKIDYIVHAASLASPQYYGVCPIEVLEPNVIGTYYLLRLAEEKAVKGFLMFSTGDIYGVVNGRDKITETDYGVMDTLDIHNCYGESKRMAETMCKAWCHQKRVPAKVARIWHTYAPTMNVEKDPRVFASFVNDILHNRDIVMLSDGKAKRSFCYIADAVAAFFLILLSGMPGEAYNVCNTKEFYSIMELAEKMVCLYPEKGLKVIRKNRPETDAYVENSVANYVPPDNAKLKGLGWDAEYGIERGFKRVIDYFMD